MSLSRSVTLTCPRQYEVSLRSPAIAQSPGRCTSFENRATAMLGEFLSLLLEGFLRLIGALFLKRKVLLQGARGVHCQMDGKRYFIESSSAFHNSKQVVIE